MLALFLRHTYIRVYGFCASPKNLRERFKTPHRDSPCVLLTLPPAMGILSSTFTKQILKNQASSFFPATMQAFYPKFRL